MYKNFIKRIIDYIIAFVALVVISPLFIIITVILLFTNNGKPFFIQKRVGKHEKEFGIIKFKTMADKYNEGGKRLPDNERITDVGRLLRRMSLDEIPQLINILSGKMSLIGPRPLPKKYLPYYTQEERIRHNVLPGITGLAQAEGRNKINWDRKLEYDIQYVNNISLFLDIKIFFKTIHNILSKNDVSSTGIDAPGNFDVYRINKNKLLQKQK